MTDTTTTPTQPDAAAEPAAAPQETEDQKHARAAAARNRFAQMVDLLRGSATTEEQENACDLLRPIVQQVNGRL